MKRRGLWWKIPTAALALVLAAVLGYLCYALLTYYRVEDWQTLTVNGQGGGPAETDRSYKLLSYNIGFGAYSPDYGFFMDGGDYSRAFSEEAARANVTGALETAAGQAPDFVFLQEVDADATRSYHVDEQQMAAEALGGDWDRLLLRGGRYDPRQLAEDYRREDLSAYGESFCRGIARARKEKGMRRKRTRGSQAKPNRARTHPTPHRQTRCRGRRSRLVTGRRRISTPKIRPISSA